MMKAEEPGATETDAGVRVVDWRVVRAARKRARRFPWSVGTAPKGAGESALGTEEEDRVLREARAAAWRRSLEREVSEVVGGGLSEGKVAEAGAEGAGGRGREG